MKKKMVAVRIDENLLEAMDKKAKSIEAMLGTKVSMQQMLVGALRQVYLIPADSNNEK